MEAGYDYTLLGGRPQGNVKYLPALFVAVLAGVMLITGVAYYGFASDAQADQVSAQIVGAEAGAEVSTSGTGVDGSSGAVKYTRYVSPASAETIAGQELYPAGYSEAEHWVNPLGFEP